MESSNLRRWMSAINAVVATLGKPTADSPSIRRRLPFELVSTRLATQAPHARTRSLVIANV
jgi:hypothetical protein